MKRILIFALIIGLALLVARHPLSPFKVGPKPIENVDMRFALCPKQSDTACVVDGDTFRYKERRIRVVGIDAPELFPPRCDALRTILNQGAFVMEGDKRDQYGRELRTIIRDGDNLGTLLVDQGLVHASRPFEDTPSWCD